MLDNHTTIRELFPFLKKFIYLDSAHYTPYPLNVVSKINEFVVKFTTDYLNLSLANMEICNNLRQNCAKLINAVTEDITITSSTTHGINIFANGIILNQNDKNVAFIDSEFPAVVYPWLNQERLGRVNAYMIPSSKGYVNETVIKRLLLENNIRVFSISYVQFLGYRYNIKSISDFCRKNNILLVVDAIQAAGICPIDVEELGIDFLCCGNQKWLMSPAGTGFTYISKKYRELIHPSYVSTINVNYDFENFLDYKLEFKEDASVYENSTPNTLGMIGMSETIRFFLQLGIENIYNHIIDLQNRFMELIDKDKYKIESDLNEVHRSNILIFSAIDKVKNKEIQAKLAEKNIFIALREGFLRLSAHIYNNYDDIETLVRELNAF